MQTKTSHACIRANATRTHISRQVHQLAGIFRLDDTVLAAAEAERLVGAAPVGFLLRGFGRMQQHGGVVQERERKGEAATWCCVAAAAAAAHYAQRRRSRRHIQCKQLQAEHGCLRCCFCCCCHRCAYRYGFVDVPKAAAKFDRVQDHI